MNVTVTSLEALILKATHESLPCPDAAALEAFCTIMKDSVEGPMFAAQTLAARIHTPNAREALLALSMLDRCMRRCDSSFHSEVGKFRFLNEMIKLVSPKYFADRTAPEVRTRVLQLLHAWSIEYPKETKFKVAYDMLKNQGVVKETPPPLPPEDTPPPRARAKSAIFEDDEKSKLLQKLLQSKKPEDLQHANRLIKTMVREEERRNEASSRRAQEVGAALDSAGLLRDMLERAADASSDEQQLIHELHASCARLRPALQRLAACDAQAEDLNDILHASDVLDEVFEKYNHFVSENKDKPRRSPTRPFQASDTLLDFAGARSDRGDDDGKHNDKHNVIDQLGDIFLTDGSSNIAEPLKPVSLMPSEDVDLLGDKTTKTEAWNELNSLGEQLLKQSLPDSAKRLDNFNSKQTKKIPMNALEKSSPKQDAPTANGAAFDLDFFTRKSEDKISPDTLSPRQHNPPPNGDILDLEFFTKKPEDPKVTLALEPKATPTEPTVNESKVTPNDDVMVDITPNTSNAIMKPDLESILDLGSTIDKGGLERMIVSKEEKRDKRTSDVKPLTDLFVTLESVEASVVPPRTVFEEEGGVTVVLHFCKDRPRADVRVIVVSTTSKCKSTIEDYKFQAVVPKGCKVRLLTPSGSTLPPYNPFLPPPALTQVMLIARPTPSPALDLKFVITYTCDDDTCSEMGEVKQLPLDDV